MMIQIKKNANGRDVKVSYKNNIITYILMYYNIFLLYFYSYIYL